MRRLWAGIPTVLPLRRQDFRGTRLLRLATLLALAPLAAGAAVLGAIVATSGDEGHATIPEASQARPVERTSFLAKLIPPPAGGSRVKGPPVPRSVADLIRRLPLERKVAQLFLFGFKGRDLNSLVFQQLRRLDLGGIVIDSPNYTNAQLLGQMAGEARVISRQQRHVPPWVMAQQEGGRFNAFPDLPPSDPPARMGSPPVAAREAREAGKTLRALGITGLLAPVVDVGVDGGAVGDRAYSDDLKRVAAYAVASVRAYRRAHMFVAVSHFPGLGSASEDTQDAPATVGLSPDELRRRDLVPFRAAFRAGAQAVVLSHALYAFDNFTRPASLSPHVATGLLRRQLHFHGLAITDDLADPPITSLMSIPDAAVRAIKAGADTVYISGPAGDQQAAYLAVLRAARRHQIPRSRITEAVARVLLAKKRVRLIR